MKKLLLFVVCALLAFSSTAVSQTLEETLQKMAQDAAQGYVGPIVSGFGANLNGGWFHRSPSAKMFGFDLEFGVVAMGTFMKDAGKTFSVNGQFQFSGGPVGTNSPAEVIAQNVTGYGALPNAQKQQIIDAISAISFSVGISGPTVVGSKNDSVTVLFPNQTINFPAPVGTRTVPVDVPVKIGVTGLLEDATIVPLVAPQLSIGTLVGTQFTFRYLPEVEVSKEIGKFKYFGFGIQHNPGIWFPNPLPVDFCAAFFTQKLSVGSLFETKSTAFGLNVSKRFGPGALNVTPYAGFMFESSSMTFTYDNALNVSGTATAQHVAFELKGENKSRFTIGLSLKILFLNINADYNLGKYNSATAGLMFII